MKRPAPREAPASAPRAAAPATFALVAAAALAGVTAFAAARHYAPFLADDALISLRYAQRLLAGHGLTWTDGPRVEGYSNLLWILLVAIPGALGADLVAAARVLGAACAIATAMLVAWRAGREHGAAGALVAGVAVAASGPLAVWAMAGLETPLVGALLAWALVALRTLADDGADAARAARAAALPLALLSLARPDGALFAVTFALALLLARGPRRDVWAACAWLVAPALACVAAQELFRLAYYHSPVPNPARIKLALTSHRLAAGAAYLQSAFAAGWPLALATVAGTALGFARRERRGATLVLALPLVAWLAYVVFIGGDFFPGWRHLLPAVVLAAPLAANLVTLAPGRARLASLAAACALVGAFAWTQRASDENERANRETWVWQGESTARQLARAFGPQQPLLAVVSAGCFPFWSGLPSLDMLGLCDAWIATHPPKDVGEGWVGHELGDAAYVLRRAPDLVQFSGIRGSFVTGWFRAERELAASREFREHYALVTFEADAPVPVKQPLWVRLDSPRIGIARTADAVRVPAWLFAMSRTCTATSDAEGRLGVDVSEARPAAFAALPLAPGRWRARLEPPDASAIVGARRAGTDEPFARVGDAGLASGALDRWDLVLSAAPGASVRVRTVVLERDGGAR